MSKKFGFVSGLKDGEDEVIEVPSEEELTRPISGSPLLLIDLPRETVPLLDLNLEDY